MLPRDYEFELHTETTVLKQEKGLGRKEVDGETEWCCLGHDEAGPRFIYISFLFSKAQGPPITKNRIIFSDCYSNDAILNNVIR